MTHPNSAESNRTTKKQIRYEQILDALERERRAMTDRQLKNYLRLSDMNDVRPRITELIKMGKVREVGNTTCRETLKTVRLVQLEGGGLF